MKSKLLFVILLISTILTSCTSTTKLYEKGYYDAVIDRCIKKILKNKNDKKSIEMLDNSYNLANLADNERIKYLKTEGNPQSWEEIAYRYTQLKVRQEKVRKILPLYLDGKIINYPVIDYDKELVDSKKNASEYFYNHALELIKTEIKENYRKAYYEFIKAKNLSFSSLKNIDNLINEAHYKGISYVLLIFENNSLIKFPPEIVDRIMAINPSNINSFWVEYHLQSDKKINNYDYLVYVNILRVEISPDKLEEKENIYKQKIQDGYEYVLDKKGNVMKDSAGNDIKVPKYKELTCTVIEKHKQKVAKILGEIEYVNNYNKQTIHRVPIEAGITFNYIHAKAFGEITILPEEIKNLINKKDIPFPDPIGMIFDACESLRNSIQSSLEKNSYIIK